MTLLGSGRMLEILEKQKRAFREGGAPDISARKDRLRRAIGMLTSFQDRIVEAAQSDFGTRPVFLSKAAEVLSGVGALGGALAGIDEWVKPEERPLVPGTAGPGARAEIHYQPLGTVGVIAPWNAPFMLSVSPLAGIFAAGNSAMIKPSEFAPASAELLAEMVAQFFDETEVAVFTGGADVSAAFSGLPFDHLMFTGSIRTAKLVMKAAAENLVPVTLELGGKSPVIIGEGADIELAALRIVHGKLLNSGQICISPDYVYVPEAKVKPFVEACLKAAAQLYPSMAGNGDYTSMINEQHYLRILELLKDAKARGAQLVEANPAREDFGDAALRKLPLSIVTNVNDDMKVMQEEIFGPVLPIKPYGEIGEAIRYVNDQPNPLAVYYFGNDEAETSLVIERTRSGNIAINDVLAQGMRDEIPYGGVGASGMGAYKGIDGFRNFSHAKPVFYQTDLEAALQPMRPPYTPEALGFIEGLLSQDGPAA
ncbi:MAG: coniferyl aldehyde dehydrogenase [Sphingomonadales bacterium]|nr:MAG: coniferyl aldehyde dehydrogenase [Sphingomonadales bacterium]TNF06398.1 MAG: coniferyl aldehyde dehydrogenase [Sphingomonadales bacterium]